MPNGTDKISISISELCPIRENQHESKTDQPEVRRTNSEINYHLKSLRPRQQLFNEELWKDRGFWSKQHETNNRLTAEVLIPSVYCGGDRYTLRPRGRTIRENVKKSREKVHTRSSDAVQKRVKKISEDFTITQINFENSNKPNSVMINLDRSQLLSPKFPRGISSMKSICSKCENFPSKPTILPLFSATSEDQTCSDETSSDQNLDITQEDKQESQGESEEEPVVDAHSSSSSTNSPASPEEISCQDNDGNSNSPILHRSDDGENRSHHCSRGIGKKRCLSASTSPRVHYVTLVQLKRARQFTERAIKEGRVFSIYGHFPAVRQALKSRGWVEKVLQRTPYVNPHPANCVCFQAHCTSALMLNSPAATSGDQTQRSSVVSGRSQLNFVERNRRLCRFFRNKQIVLEEVEETPRKNEYNQSEQMNDEDSCDSINETENIVPEEPIEGSIQTNATLKEEPEESESLEANAEKKEYRFKFNPTTLCPLEIRCGIDKCINENNESLYKYTIPVYNPVQITKQCSSIQPNPQEEECSPPERPSPVPSAEDVTEETFQDSRVEDESPQIQSPDKCVKETLKATENEEAYNPLDPYPDLNFKINDVDPSLVGRLLNNVEPNLIWTWTRDTVSYKHLTKDQLVNRFPNTIFTTKHGLCSTMQQLHWFSEAPSAETFVPRGYCIGQAEERDAFEQDYRLTACLGLLGWLSETYATGGYDAVASAGGEVAVRRVRLAVTQVQQFVDSCTHDHLDSPVKAPLHDPEWEAILSAHHRTVHRGCKLKATQQQLEAVVQECIAVLRRAEQHWPQLGMDGVRNTWIVKPGAQSRGRGILIMHSLSDILALVQSPFIYETKYVVQKYMERPFLVYNTKFDIRQWFLVTDWNPLTVWMYRSSYVRFCSQEYDMSRTHEAVHLSNNAIQCKYANGRRHHRLPHENMWDSNTFEAFLQESGWGGAWKETVYPGMKDALVAAMLAAQVQMDSFRSGFELFGADFMLSEDLRPWLIEINSSPCMAPTSSVTRRLCAQCLQDIIKVVVDQRVCRHADTGQFELIHRDAQKLQPTQPYLGVNLQITGKQISRYPPPPEKPKRLTRPRTTAQTTIRPLRLVSLGVGPAASCGAGGVLSSLCRSGGSASSTQRVSS